MDLSGLMGGGLGGSGGSKEFGSSQAATTVGGNSYGSDGSPQGWLWPVVAIVGAALLTLVLINLVKKL